MRLRKKIAEASTAVKEGFNSTVDKERLIATLNESASSLSNLRVSDDLSQKKQELQRKIETAIDEVTESKNFKINQIKFWNR